jgi:hypothetical protein
MAGKKMIGRRSFIATAVTAGCAASALLKARGTDSPQPLCRLTIETGGPARIEVRGADHEMYQPQKALMDRTAARQLAGKDDYYLGHFTSTGTTTLDLPAGQYTVVVEKGLEFERLESVVELNAEQTLRLVPKRWVDMASQGWWSGDMHLHRPPAEAKILLTAEDLNLGVFFTMWNAQNHWEGKEIPSDPVERADATHVATLMNAEDERGGGAWMMHNLKKPLALGAAQRWYPQGRVFVDAAKAQGAWFDCEKPIWWEVPVMAALTHIDSLGVLHNHYDQYGMYANEAWGRPRDQKLFPGNDGFSDYSLSLYYRYLNLGHRLPASAGSASGVLPSPPGYNRVYAYAPEGFSVAGFYAAFKAGRNFVTNGPVLEFSVNGKMPGDTIDVSSRQPLQVLAKAQAREPIDRIEIVANGKVVAATPGAKLEAEINPEKFTWLAARCYLKPGVTIRLAHSSPIYLTAPGQTWDAHEDRAYFVKWIDDLIAETESDPQRFQNADQKAEVLRIYYDAYTHYSKRAH